MRKASNIILLISAILVILCTILYVVFGAVFIWLGSTPEGAQELAKNAGLGDGPYDPAVLQALAVFLGVVLIFAAIFAVVDAVMCFLARGRQTKGLYIATIVFGVLSGFALSLLGGIFGLVANAQESK